MAPAVWWDQQVHVERRADLWVLFLALCVLLPLAVSAHRLRQGPSCGRCLCLWAFL